MSQKHFNGCEVIDVALVIASSPEDYPEAVGMPLGDLIRWLKEDDGLECRCSNE